jgi:integrase/recombinase XerD
MKKTNYYEICKQKLNLFNFSENTKKIYLHYIIEFFNNIEVPYSRLNSSDLQEYIINYNYSSTSQQNQVISSLKFLYKEVLGKKYNKISFIRPKKEKKLPKIIDSETIIKKINSIENLKHKTILSLCYSVGLRVSEIVNLKINDIDSKRMLININNAKGKKDRIVPLSENILILLRNYYKQYKPKIYLFNGQNSEKYSIQSCQQIYKKYIDSETSIHNLRHSCFTTLLETGVDLKIISNIAGHSNVKTTEIYVHVSTNILNKVKLPI